MVKYNHSFELEEIEINDENHQKALLSLMDDYMLDEMGLNKSLPAELASRIVSGLKKQNNYLGFLLKYENEYIALANCFVGFSTFKAMQLINIHDFIVSPKYRRLGAGKALLDQIAAYANLNDFCKVSLEVRYDNSNAQELYKKVGFQECNPPMYFWEKICR